MTPLKPGDKVKFLNTSGGGVVSKIIDSRMVSVLIEDGFEIPTMISELIKIDPAEPAARFFEEHYKIDLPVPPDEPEEPEDERVTLLPKDVAAERKSEEVLLAFVPHDQKWLISGPLDVFLINSSSYDILYNIFSRTPVGHYQGIDYGSVLPDTKLLIATINREQLTHWTEGSLQFLFHKENTVALLPPFNSEFRVEGKRFYKEGNYRENRIIRAKGIVVRVLSLTEYFSPESESGNIPSGDGKITDPNPKPLIFLYQAAPQEALIDLHIHELVDDHSNFEKSEILEFQKNHFLKCLDSAIANHFRKVIFIHGVGNGILRAVILEILKKQKGIEFFDAPMARYGTGALEVRILQNP